MVEKQEFTHGWRTGVYTHGRRTGVYTHGRRTHDYRTGVSSCMQNRDVLKFREQACILMVGEQECTHGWITGVYSWLENMGVFSW